MNQSYDILLGPENNNKLSNLLNISFEDLNIIFGNWFIFSIHFVIRAGTTKSFNLKNIDLSKIGQKSRNFSLEQDFYLKLYILRSIGVYEEFDLDSILRLVKEQKYINNHNNSEVFESSSKNKIIKKTLENNFKELINYLIKNSDIKSFKFKKSENIINFILKNLPTLFDKDVLHSYKNNLAQTKDIRFSKSLNGDNVKANVLITMKKKIITRQHGVQEGMIAYHPNIFYLEKSKIVYYSYNKKLMQTGINCKKSFINWRNIFKGLIEYMDIDFLKSILQIKNKLNRNIIIFIRGGVPGQIPIYEYEINHRMLRDIYKLCVNLSKNFNIIIRPHPTYNFSSKDFFKEVDMLANVSVDYQRKYKFQSEDIFLCNYFSSAIMERTFGKGNIILYMPDYFYYSKVNNIGKYFFEKTNLNHIIFDDIGKLVNSLNSIFRKDKKFFLNKLVLKFKILKLLIF
ncbi:hypothetical protein [Prochlorococcus marinus]|uniref:hypothetical protein n=1 Tax=Prochlorococcus marinus TaxID=1219 RepID=UPI00130DE12C|nr:hypothetical protein [Prochlorococcus marinus]